MPRQKPQDKANKLGPSPLWRRCGIVLGAILLLAVAKEVALQQTIDGLDSEGALINNAGRQRMLSQQIAKLMLAASLEQQTANPDGVEEQLDKLKRVVGEFKIGHREVQHRAMEDTFRAHSPEVTQQFRELEAPYFAVLNHAHRVLTRQDTVDPAEWRADIHAYAKGVNAIVDQLALESRQRVLAARSVSRWGLAAIIALTALAEFLVLRPQMRRVSKERREYQETLGQLNMERVAGDVLNDSLRGALALNRAVFSTAADSVIIFNRDGVIEQANRSAAETFDIPEEQLVDGRFQDLMSEGYANIHEEYLQHASETTSDGVLLRNLSVRGKRSDGSYFPAELSVSKVQASGRTVFTGMLRDVTERVQLESSLAQARKMESVGHLASGIAHEINTPMQFIATNINYMSRQLDGWNELIEGLQEVRKGELSAEELTRQQLELIHAAPKAIAFADLRGAIDDSLVGVDRVVEIIGAMKDFAHPGSGSKDVVDINHVINTAAVIARNRTKEVANVTLDLDEACEPFSGVTSGLNQTFVNLLVNAADAIEEASQDRGGRGDIRITSKRVEEGVEVLVSDTGCGMSPEIAAHAFDPFYTTKDIGKGSGQGLAIAYNAVVEQNQGRIAIESAPGEGTTFRIFLPVRKSTEDAESNLVEAVV